MGKNVKGKNTKENKFMTDIVRDFSRKENITLADSKEIIESFLDLIEDTVKEGHDIILTGFGKFYFAKKNEKRGIHPITKEPILTPAYNTMLFKASDRVKNKFNED